MLKSTSALRAARRAVSCSRTAAAVLSNHRSTSIAATTHRPSSYSTTQQDTPRVLITGCGGQIGTELVNALRDRFGAQNVVASDLKTPTAKELAEGPYVYLNALDGDRLDSIVKQYNITWLIHNAAFLSAMAERNPKPALKLNCEGLHSVLDVALENNCRLMVPSSIAAFGRSTPLDDTPDFTVQRPESIYGIGKLYAELMGEYYNKKKGLDFRSLRYPGIISYKTEPGGGTTDYAVDMFFYALRGEHYECYLQPNVYLPMMYMPDCIKATIDLMDAPQNLLEQRVFNVAAFSFTPEQLARAIQKYVPSFTVSYKPDTIRQPLAESWPNSLDDANARVQWKWRESFDLDAMVADMLINIANARGAKVPVNLKLG